ncbi:MAG: autotransporter domain-containing protein, partial [Schwartzia sp.]|nr:autotransporter domain-containing protein [Schwartzia sp. (in: firmicutes)]
EIGLKGGNTVDVYGKYFYNRRNGVSFDAGPDRYDLDAVTSSVLRVGARYTMKRERWNFYGGLAYEHELDGKARGRANGVPIRGADIGGGSARLELGATMTPAKSPWTLDLNLTGFAGKKRGVSGGLSVAWMF